MNNPNIDKPESNCGIFGIAGTPSASLLTYYGLIAQQHRGQEAAGIVSNSRSNGKTIFKLKKGKGLVSEIFNDEKIFNEELCGIAAIGHNRYSTSGSNSLINVQPFIVKYRQGNLAISHNGNLTNAHILRKQLIDEGAIFQTTSDTEIILHLISRSRQEKQIDQIIEALQKVSGAFSLVILTDEFLYACRDTYGVRPLNLGLVGNSYVVASETCAFDLIDAKYIREIERGEVLAIKIYDDHSEIFERKFLDNIPEYPKKCIFEFIYFARPDSVIFNENVDKIRRNLGKKLAEESPVLLTNDKKLAVLSVPDSSNTIAIGYNNQLRKMNIESKFEIGLIRSHYIGRTFIQPEIDKRKLAAKMKFNTVKGVLQNRNIVVVDDSIVRGTTSKQLINLIKEANPAQVHFRVASPPITHPCFYGMDFPTKEELIANRMNNDITQIQDELGVDSLKYLSYEGLINCTPEKDDRFYCTACFTGNYPIPVDQNLSKEIYEV
ncbi:MAG: amidophosphoribosyltransferase [Ignavibacteria bacterium]